MRKRYNPPKHGEGEKGMLRDKLIVAAIAGATVIAALALLVWLWWRALS
jgi:hypothetical protein